VRDVVAVALTEFVTVDEVRIHLDELCKQCQKQEIIRAWLTGAMRQDSKQV
jgi:hypothetical protein